MEETEQEFIPQFYQFDVIEDDIKPFILETLKYALCFKIIRSAARGLITFLIN